MASAAAGLLLAARSPLSLPRQPLRVLGIDLGTTNSTVAEIVWQPGELPFARCLEIEQPTDTGPYTHVLVPSVVALQRGRAWVGEGAKRLRADASLKRNRDIFYECKNDIGTRRTYHLAPPGYRSAADIAGHVLAFLMEAAQRQGSGDAARTVVTVPASFQAAQRHDTLQAARAAGIAIQPGDLLDEPVAAFLDYLITHRDELHAAFARPSVLLIFDFGGGTCDVAIFRVRGEGGGRRDALDIAPLAVSRYHRLGGGDIDAAIVHEELIPQLIQQHGLEANALAYDHRKRHLEPALLGVAETLKIGLCIELARLAGFGSAGEAQAQQLVKAHPGVWPCPCPGHPELALRSPRLSAARFDEILRPFLDTEFLYARETEYYLTCSIFAPVQDAIDRAGLSRDEIDCCLLVGGSSLIPQVRRAMQRFLPGSRLLMHGDRESTQVAVARGAAYHALALAVCGQGLVRPVAADDIALRVATGLFTLVPRGAPLPYPSDDGWIEHAQLVVPESCTFGSIPLRVEAVAGGDERPVLAARWDIPGPVRRGESLRLRVRLDANQVLHLELTLRDRPGSAPFACRIEHPLTVVVNPNATRQRIDEVEEDLRTNRIPAHRVAATIRALADDYAEIGQIDKAIDYLQQALRRSGPDAETLNQLGCLYGRKQDWQRQETAYREAFRVAPHWAGPLFNLALAQYHRQQYDAALQTIEQALRVERCPPYAVLQAMILEQRRATERARQAVREALGGFGPVAALSDWELGWLITAARMAGDRELAERGLAEQRARQRRGGQPPPAADGFLPELAPAVRKA